MPKKSEKSTVKYIPPAIFFLVSLVFTLPFILKWGYIGVGDWELFTVMAAVPERTVLHFHQFPFWNPYLGGGNILFAHPEVGILSPFFLLILIFGAVGGLKLQVLVAYFLGFYGSYLMARKLGISNIGSYMVSFAYFGSSYFALHFSIGHIPFTHFCFLPWFVYFILKTGDNWKYIFAAALSIALIILGNGAAVPFLYTAFFSGLFVLLYAIDSKSIRPIKSYIVAIILGLLMAAVKFIPMYHYLSQNQWTGMAQDTTPLKFILPALFSFDQAIFRTIKTAEHWGWHEYSAYISPLIIILAVIGLIYAFRKSRIWLILAAFFFVFGLGHFSDFSLWGLMHHFPGFSSIRSPARAFQFVILAVSIMAAFGLDNILPKIKLTASTKKIASIGLIVLIIGINYLINLPAFNSIANKKPKRVTFDKEFRHVIGSKFEIYDLFQKNQGSLMAPWLSAYKDSRGIVTENNDVFMEYVIRGQADIVRRLYTPNQVDYDLSPRENGAMVFGIGYDEGWYASDGRRLYESNGLITADFGAGDKHITLHYRTPYFYLGFIISLLAIAACLFMYINRNFGKRFKAILD